MPNLYACYCGPRPGDLEHLVATAGAGKVLFGSDFGAAGWELLPERIDNVLEAELSPEEREPILLWVQEDSTYWVDAEGVFFPVLADRGDLVRLEVRERGLEIAFDGKPQLDPAVVVHALELTIALPSGTPLIFDAGHGLGMMDPGGWMVYFGNSGQIEEKLDVYRRLMDSLSGRGIRPVTVSLENLRQPFYRR